MGGIFGGSSKGPSQTTTTNSRSTNRAASFAQPGIEQATRGLADITSGGVAGLGTELTDPYRNLLQQGMGLAGSEGYGQNLVGQVMPGSLGAFQQGLGNLSSAMQGGGGISPEAQALMQQTSNDVMNRMAGLGGQSIYGSGAVDSMGRPTTGGGGSQLANAMARGTAAAMTPIAMQDLYRQQDRSDDARRQALNMAPMLGQLSGLADDQELRRMQAGLQSGAAFNPLGSEQNQMLSGLNPYLAATGQQANIGNQFGTRTQNATQQSQQYIPNSALAMQLGGSLLGGLAAPMTGGASLLGNMFSF